MIVFVPVHAGPAGLVVRMFRDPLGKGTAVGFTTQERLLAALGANTSSTRIGEQALREIAAFQGIRSLVIDPTLAIPSTQPAADVASRELVRTGTAA